MKNNKLRRKLKVLFVFITVVTLLFGFTLLDESSRRPANPPSGNWYQQFMPNLNGQPISDVFFLDSLTGWAITNDNLPNDSGYVLKTTNGGDNWIIKYKDRGDFTRVKFINSTIGFASGGSGSGTPYFYRSTDGGDNWSLISTFGCSMWQDMNVLNNDTIWLVDNDGLCGGVFRTNNGGGSWTQQLGGATDKIYMFNARIGFINSGGLRKTTDGGATWNLINGTDGFRQIYFADSLTGWKCSVQGMKKSTDGGLNWVTETLPTGGIIQNSLIGVFSALNGDTLWGAGGYVQYPNNQIRGILYRTVNGGANWQFQIPDTSINVGYAHMIFTDKHHGWVYDDGTGIHTTTGGDPVWLTGLQQISSELPNEFKLYQNYPNPFNPNTKIRFSLIKPAYVQIKIYDAAGKEINPWIFGWYPETLLEAGTHEFEFGADNLASGVYFFKLIVTDGAKTSGKTYESSIKMVLVK